MIRSKIAKVFMLAFCLTILSSSIVLANAGGGALPQPAVTPGSAAGSAEAAVSSTAQGQQAVNDDLLQKQQEIDRYIFEQHKEDIAGKGFTVTHTAPLENHVEIGITPYSEENADYLYGIFGKDMVKVVEGQQAVLLNTTVKAEPAANPDAAVSPNAAASSDLAANPDAAANPNAIVIAEAANRNSANDAFGGGEKVSGSESSTALPYMLGAAAVLGVAVIIRRKLKAVRG